MVAPRTAFFPIIVGALLLFSSGHICRADSIEAPTTVGKSIVVSRSPPLKNTGSESYPGEASPLSTSVSVTTGGVRAPNAQNAPLPIPNSAPKGFYEGTPETAYSQSVERYFAEQRRLAALSRLPAFPWPPPLASATQVISKDSLRNLGMKDVADRLAGSLQHTGYEYSFFSVPDGFALATKVEQVDGDGNPMPPEQRWSSAIQRRFFFAPQGYFRFLVFVVTDQPFSQAKVWTTPSEYENWRAHGLNELPQEIALPFALGSFSCTALIYEFAEEGYNPVNVEFLRRGRFAGKYHLQKAGLWQELSGSE